MSAMKYQHTCGACGNVFYNSRKQSELCPSCLGKKRRPERKFSRPIYIHHCDICGKEFSNSKKDSSICVPCRDHKEYEEKSEQIKDKEKNRYRDKKLKSDMDKALDTITGAVVFLVHSISKNTTLTPKQIVEFRSLRIRYNNKLISLMSTCTEDQAKAIAAQEIALDALNAVDTMLKLFSRIEKAEEFIIGEENSGQQDEKALPDLKSYL